LRAIPFNALGQATQATYATGYSQNLYGYGDFFYGPVVDGSIIRGLPSNEFLQGHFSKVPLIVDREGYEGVTFSNRSLSTKIEEETDLKVLWPNAGPAFFKRLFQIYPASDFNSTFFQRVKIFGDAVVTCPSYYMAMAAANYDLPVWKLVFNAGTEEHGATVPFLYSTSTTGNSTPLRFVRWFF